MGEAEPATASPTAAPTPEPQGSCGCTSWTLILTTGSWISDGGHGNCSACQSKSHSTCESSSGCCWNPPGVNVTHSPVEGEALSQSCLSSRPVMRVTIADPSEIPEYNA